MNVLVVEDDPTDRKLVGAVLKTSGHFVRENTSAEDAIGAIAVQRPDIIVMDMRLPGMDGIAFTKKLKSNPETREIPIVAVTAYPDQYLRVDLIAAGCDSCIVKPIDTRELPNQLSLAVSKAKRGDK